jgi:hypothetical protein
VVIKLMFYVANWKINNMLLGLYHGESALISVWLFQKLDVKQ